MMPTTGPELWGGVECSIVRVGDRYRDQFAELGHDARIGDLDLIAGLGIRTLRYPVLWEAVSPPDAPLRGWDWHDRRLERIRELGIRPIVGLIHHGSGPPGTDLLDPGFPDGLADHARRVAERYPWVDAYTPVNEPLTTARFSCLYGHWYPHGRSGRDFLRALVHQCQAVIRSMAAIRGVVPGAQLVQTEDIGRIFATGPLAGQAAYENERRWLSLDLLFGRVRPGHACWDEFLHEGIAAEALAEFWDVPCPDLVGVNHYLTSDRYLDPDRAGYPEHHWGGNGRDAYADAEAVRIPSLAAETGLSARIREVAARYDRPIAVTELHHGCTRDEQLRWLRDGWDEACALRAEGIDLRAITLWSLFGAVDWNSLLTARHGHYEPGDFDVRGPEPRPTALATAAASLVRAGHLGSAAIGGPGWWRRPERCYRSDERDAACSRSDWPLLLLVGGDTALADECRAVGFGRGWAVERVDPRDPAGTGRIGAAAAVLDASAIGPGRDLGDLAGRAEAAARRRRPFAFLSAADIFAGEPGSAHREGDPPQPGGAWGQRLAEAEATVRRHHADALVIRTGHLFGPASDPDEAPLAALDDGEIGPGTHSYLPDLLHVVLDLMIDRETGIRHLVNPGVAAGTTRPAPVRLDTDRGCLLPPLSSAAGRYGAAVADRPPEPTHLQAAE